MTNSLTGILIFLVLAIGCKERENNQESGTGEILWTASWSPDGKYIAFGGNTSVLHLYSVDNHQLHKVYPVRNTITQLDWHPEESLLAIGTQISDEEPFILHLEDDSRLSLDSLSVNGGVRGIRWNPGGELLATGDNEGFLSIFTLKGVRIKKIETRQKAITGLDWHPDLNIIVTVGSHIELYDMDGDSIQIIQPREEEVLMLSVAWHPDGEFFVTGDYGDYDKDHPPLLQFWDAHGKKIRDVNGSKAEYRNIAWHPDGKLLATASDSLRIWSESGELLHAGGVDELLWGVDWSPDGQKIVTSSESGNVMIWDKEATLIEPIND